MPFCVHSFHHEKYQDKWESYTVTKLTTLLLLPITATNTNSRILAYPGNLRLNLGFSITKVVQQPRCFQSVLCLTTSDFSSSALHKNQSLLPMWSCYWPCYQVDNNLRVTAWPDWGCRGSWSQTTERYPAFNLYKYKAWMISYEYPQTKTMHCSAAGIWKQNDSDKQSKHRQTFLRPLEGFY